MKRNITACKDLLHNCGINFFSQRPSCSFHRTVHYSYDNAPQVHIASNPQQSGPSYFKTPRKCGLFEICCEGIPRQVNYLINKAVCTRNGANSTISYVYDFFSSHRAGETDAQNNADNCGGKTKTTLLYGTTPGEFFAGSTNQYCIHF